MQCRGPSRTPSIRTPRYPEGRICEFSWVQFYVVSASWLSPYLLCWPGSVRLPVLKLRSLITLADSEMWQIHLLTAFTNAGANQRERFVPFTRCGRPTLPRLPLPLTI